MGRHYRHWCNLNSFTNEKIRNNLLKLGLLMVSEMVINHLIFAKPREMSSRKERLCSVMEQKKQLLTGQ